MLRNLEKHLRFKRLFANRIIKALKDNPGISLPPAFFDSKITPAWYGFVF